LSRDEQGPCASRYSLDVRRAGRGVLAEHLHLQCRAIQSVILCHLCVRHWLDHIVDVARNGTSMGPQADVDLLCVREGASDLRCQLQKGAQLRGLAVV
jgi:hypothetical protein